MVAVPAMAHVAAAVACGVVPMRLVGVVGLGAVAGGSGYCWRDLVEAFTFASVCVVMGVGHRCTSWAAVPVSGSVLSSAPMARVSVINWRRQ
jgi:hypothetical protein